MTVSQAQLNAAMDVLLSSEPKGGQRNLLAALLSAPMRRALEAADIAASGDQPPECLHCHMNNQINEWIRAHISGPMEVPARDDLLAKLASSVVEAVVRMTIPGEDRLDAFNRFALTGSLFMSGRIGEAQHPNSAAPPAANQH